VVVNRLVCGSAGSPARRLVLCGRSKFTTGMTAAT